MESGQIWRAPKVSRLSSNEFDIGVGGAEAQVRSDVFLRRHNGPAFKSKRPRLRATTSSVAEAFDAKHRSEFPRQARLRRVVLHARLLTFRRFPMSRKHTLRLQDRTDRLAKN